MKRETYHEEAGLEGYFPGRERQEFFPQPPYMDGFMAARKIRFQSRRRSKKEPFFMNKAG
jgi:hypothetical protein